MVYFFLALGLIVLIAGAELLVRGAVTLAAVARISPLVVGLTVVAFGTSAPEMAVSAISSINGEPSIALGNVVGSNILNVLLILGVAAVITPLAVSSQLIRIDVPIMIGVSSFAWLAASDGSIGKVEGVIMLLGFATYSIWLLKAGSKELDAGQDGTFEPTNFTTKHLLLNASLVLTGLALLVWGAGLLVDSATTIARSLGVSEIVIGLTIVAAGTSLPELATSVVAAMKGQRELAVGNVVGSNIFNVLMVLSTATIVSESGVSVSQSVLWFDMSAMVLTALLCMPIFVSHGVVSRFEGAVMLLLYVAYTGLLVAESQTDAGVGAAKSIFIFAVFPSVCLVVSFLTWRQQKRAWIPIRTR